jgi:hypothetical protein
MELLSAILLFTKQYGIPIVFLTLLVIWLKPKADEGWQILMDRARAPLPMPHKGLDQMLQIDIDLNTTITEILHETEADYVTIWQFHNGAISFGGIPFLRISVTHQQVRSGNVGWGHTYQNLPTSLFVACRSFKDLVENGNSALVECNDTEGNETIIGILKAHRIKAMYVCPIRDSHDTLVALLTVSYTKKKPEPGLSKELLHTFATRSCVLLELQARLSKGG